MRFEIKDRDAAGRICRFYTLHGTVTTPTLMPVVNPNKILITPQEMKKLFGVEIVITNSYIIKKDEKLKKKALDEGVHKVIDFDGPVMTDSGTFQSYVYGKIKLDPLEIVEFQRDIGSDIGTILDVFGLPDEPKTIATQGVKETLKRAKEAVKVKEDMLIACTVQGSTYQDLREKCAKEMSEIDCDFFPIGGVVPLMENQRYSDLVKVILSCKKNLNPSKPVHLFGAGHPLVFPLSVALGCDFFDSSAYAKYAYDNRLIFPWGTEKLDDISDLPCSCPVCSRLSADELRKLDEKERVVEIAKHNLYVSFGEIKKIRNAISNGSLWELVERRATSNPYLFEALDELKKTRNKAWLEHSEPVSKNKALFYTGRHTINRPIVYRLHNRLLNWYKPFLEDILVFPEAEGKPYSIYYFDEIRKLDDIQVNLVVDSWLGPVPLELDEMYPFAQSVFPSMVDEETKKEVSKVFKKFVKGKNIFYWRGDDTLKELQRKNGLKTKKVLDRDFMRISAVSIMQFGKDASKALFNGEIKIVKSKKTGKIRNVYCNGKHILSMRANDGLFTLKIEGGKLLHKFFKYPKLRVVVDDEAVSFVKDGKSVFAKFVKDCDPRLRPLDECLIVDKNDSLLAVGRCLLNRDEMLSFDFGVAVKTREKNEF
ncbi:MAG: tRNA guanosine(15) transglycosylase TgtA [Thermoplasmata archaeon]|nr:MAG: tRNA guanosine(15) transglycosylase TgtA [Thermoplasmata archaeon]